MSRGMRLSWVKSSVARRARRIALNACTLISHRRRQAQPTPAAHRCRPMTSHNKHVRRPLMRETPAGTVPLERRR